MKQVTLNVPQWHDLRGRLNALPWWLLYVVGAADGIIVLAAVRWALR